MANKAKGNMYAFVDYTINPISGRCQYDCSYCYMRQIPQRAQAWFKERAVTGDLSEGKTFFFGSNRDMWSEDIPDEWIQRVLDYCMKYDNTYLYQSKNPTRFLNFLDHELLKSDKVILATTIETNRSTADISKAPSVQERAEAMAKVSEAGIKTMVTVEPIMKFDHDEMLALIQKCRPFQVNIGKNTSRLVKLDEPEPLEVLKLAKALHEVGIRVEFKDNIKGYLMEAYQAHRKSKNVETPAVEEVKDEPTVDVKTPVVEEVDAVDDADEESDVDEISDLLADL